MVLFHIYLCCFSIYLPSFILTVFFPLVTNYNDLISIVNCSETVNLYGKLLVEMDQIAKRMMYDAYGVDKRHCDSQLGSTDYLLRGITYAIPKKTESNLGLDVHSDYAFFSVLHQNNESGLQVRLKNGEWIDIDPSPHMLFFMASDGAKVSYFSYVHLRNFFSSNI